MDYIEALNRLTAADAMEISPTILNYEGDLEDALRLIANEDRPDVAVGNKEDIAGFIHAQDITGILARGESINVPLRTFLDSCSLSGSKPCIQVRPNESLLNVMRVMDSWGRDNVLVVGENEEPLGVISATGAIKCLWKMVSEPLLTKADPTAGY
ncbi:CBS domain-containing protein [Candidatus Methanomassiliicoccus intestinalis]|uniref:CBS domain-containing protein n=1 Tax=Candidatus Methanomassiliicoccus intestinalis TaxID=1406512 RepID=UPI0037DC0E33